MGTGMGIGRCSPSQLRLIALNVALVAALGVVSVLTMSPAHGQAGNRRGEYAIVSGRVLGSTASVLYVLDASNQQLMALSWDTTNNRVLPIGYRSVVDDGKFQNRPR